jgi:hypothetical protein
MKIAGMALEENADPTGESLSCRKLLSNREIADCQRWDTASFAWNGVSMVDSGAEG